jgi:hypothetical protein
MHRLVGALRWRASRMFAAGLVLAVGAHGALAVEPPEPPTLSEVKPLDANTLDFTWSESGQQPIDGIRFNFYQSGNLAFIVDYPTGDKKSERLAAARFPDLKPKTRYCLGLKAYIGSGNNDDRTFSDESERQCFTSKEANAPTGTSSGAPPADAPPKPEAPTNPDLAVTRLTGPTTVFDGATAIYQVALWNDGAPAKGTAQVQIGLMGAIEPVRVVDPPNGFTCDLGEFGFSCTGSLGGVDDPVQTRGAVFRVQVRGNGTGSGTVIGSANHDRALDEVTVDNNLKLFEVVVK